MDKIQSLIEKLWNGTISPEESALLDNAIKNVSDDENNKIKNHFKKLYEQDTAPLQNNKNAAMLLERIMESIAKMEGPEPKQMSLGRRYIWWAAAAIVGICFIFYFQINNPTSNKVDHKVVNVLHQLKIIENKQQRNIDIALPDGSLLVLFPGSKISYNEEFNKKDRIINLTGKAVFKVAKDKKRPFSVLSAGFSTTALGTKFSVSRTKENQVEIKLFEGSVRVRDTSSMGKAMPDIYLKPGQLVTLNKLSAKYAITAFKQDKNTLTGTTEIYRNQEIATNAPLIFNNAPLNSVLQKLSEKYKTPINYDRTTVNGLYFTGTVEQTDSLHAVLTIITNMNGLRLKDVEGNLIITK